MNKTIKERLESEDFRAGIAYAAHVLRHAVNLAHGHSGYIPSQSGLRPCCTREVIDFAGGMAAGLEQTAGCTDEHTH